MARLSGGKSSGSKSNSNASSGLPGSASRGRSTAAPSSSQKKNAASGTRAQQATLDRFGVTARRSRSPVLRDSNAGSSRVRDEFRRDSKKDVSPLAQYTVGTHAAGAKMGYDSDSYDANLFDDVDVDMLVDSHHRNPQSNLSPTLGFRKEPTPGASGMGSRIHRLDSTTPNDPDEPYSADGEDTDDEFAYEGEFDRTPIRKRATTGKSVSSFLSHERTEIPTGRDFLPYLKLEVEEAAEKGDLLALTLLPIIEFYEDEAERSRVSLDSLSVQFRNCNSSIRCSRSSRSSIRASMVTIRMPCFTTTLFPRYLTMR
jgi:hypothetical protein